MNDWLQLGGLLDRLGLQAPTPAGLLDAPVGTSTTQRVSTASPEFSPMISPGLLSNEQRLGAFWNLATRRAKPYTNADLPALAASGQEAVDAALGWAGMTTPTRKVNLDWVRAALKERGVNFTEEASRSMSETFGPSASHYFRVGDKTIRLSDHSYGNWHAGDLRYGMDPLKAADELDMALGLKPRPTVDRWAQFTPEELAQRAATAANEALLEANGMGGLTGSARKKALKKLRGEQ